MITLAATNTLQAVAGTATAITYSIFGMTLLSGAETYSVLSQGQIAGSVAAIYTVPSSTTSFVKNITLANSTGSAVSGVILYVNGTAGSNQVTGSLTIPANGMAIINDDGISIYDANGNFFTSGSNIFDSTIPADTTPLAFGITGSATTAARRDHTHQSPGGIASITSATSAINNTETAVVSAAIPANLVQAGTTFRIKAYGTCTSSVSNISTFKVRWGATGTSSDTSIGSVATANAATTGSSIPFYVEFLVVFRSTTVSECAGKIENNGVTGLTTTQTPIVSAMTNTTGLTTTSNENLTLLYVSAGTTTTCTFQIAEIEIVKM